MVRRKGGKDTLESGKSKPSAKGETDTEKKKTQPHTHARTHTQTHRHTHTHAQTYAFDSGDNVVVGLGILKSLLKCTNHILQQQQHRRCEMQVCRALTQGAALPH